MRAELSYIYKLSMGQGDDFVDRYLKSGVPAKGKLGSRTVGETRFDFLTDARRMLHSCHHACVTVASSWAGR
jgi:hypothetical protein